MTCINDFPDDHLILCICNDVACDPMWEQVMKTIFDWANTQGLKGVKVHDLQIIHPNNNDPLNKKIWVKCRLKKVKDERGV